MLIAKMLGILVKTIHFQKSVIYWAIVSTNILTYSYFFYKNFLYKEKKLYKLYKVSRYSTKNCKEFNNATCNVIKQIFYKVCEDHRPVPPSLPTQKHCTTSRTTITYFTWTTLGSQDHHRPSGNGKAFLTTGTGGALRHF